MQINYHVKSMNRLHLSEERIEWTTLTLNFTLPIFQSLKQIVILYEDGTKKYQKDTVSDSELIFNFISGKFGFSEAERGKKSKYNCYFWEQDKKVLISGSSPSFNLNKAFVTSHAYVSRHFDKIVKDFDQILSENFDDDNDNENSSDEELDF